jgi:hypothetical protein
VICSPRLLSGFAVYLWKSGTGEKLFQLTHFLFCFSLLGRHVTTSFTARGPIKGRADQSVAQEKQCQWDADADDEQDRYGEQCLKYNHDLCHFQTSKKG